MYKPVPFFMSSRGYGVFMHTSTPITCDIGKYFSGVNSLMIGDEELDLFLFLGEPKDVLDAYTEITGKSPVPPLWSFGFWMSRITYFSEAEGREVVSLLRKHKVPSDVLHFDTGWFGVDWQCDYTFAEDRFDDPVKMMSDFKDDGIRTCLWQLPYFVPKNKLFTEILLLSNGIREKLKDFWIRAFLLSRLTLVKRLRLMEFIPTEEQVSMSIIYTPYVITRLFRILPSK
jgi:alpha-D-xyloside xylohydrolase